MTRIALMGPANSIHLQRWAQALAERGHEICVLSQHEVKPGKLPTVSEIVELPYHGQTGYFLNALYVKKALKYWMPDILNAHYASGYGTTAALCGIRPLLLSVWGSDVYDFPYENVIKRRLIEFNLHKATAIASTSHAMARQVCRLISNANQILITPFGIDAKRFFPRPECRELNYITVGIVKTLAPKYGIDLLLHAFAGLLTDSRINALPQTCRLFIVGDGPQRRELEALAGALGVANQTYFAGAVPHAEVPDWLNRFDIYCAPSRLDSESFGVAVIEAGACGLPVVVSDVGGLPEVVLNGETGLVVPRENVERLQHALTTLVLDATMRKNLGQRGCEHVGSVYDWQHCIDIMEDAYTTTINMHHKTKS